MATTPVYPTGTKNFGSDVLNFSDTVFAEHVNTLRAEVVSIEDTLGSYLTLSSGWVGSFTRPVISYTWSDLKTRLANIEYGLSDAYNAKTPSGGTSGQVLAKTSSSDYDFTWVTVSTVPSQTGNSGKFLTTNGSSASWSSISQVPSVSGNTGKYLYTDGTTSSWQPAPVGPEFTLMLMG